MLSKCIGTIFSIFLLSLTQTGETYDQFQVTSSSEAPLVSTGSSSKAPPDTSVTSSTEIPPDSKKVIYAVIAIFFACILFFITYSNKKNLKEYYYRTFKPGEYNRNLKNGMEIQYEKHGYKNNAFITSHDSSYYNIPALKLEIEGCSKGNDYVKNPSQRSQNSSNQETNISRNVSPNESFDSIISTDMLEKNQGKKKYAQNLNVDRNTIPNKRKCDLDDTKDKEFNEVDVLRCSTPIGKRKTPPPLPQRNNTLTNNDMNEQNNHINTDKENKVLSSVKLTAQMQQKKDEINDANNISNKIACERNTEFYKIANNEMISLKEQKIDKPIPSITIENKNELSCSTDSNSENLILQDELTLKPKTQKTPPAIPRRKKKSKRVDNNLNSDVSESHLAPEIKQDDRNSLSIPIPDDGAESDA